MPSQIDRRAISLGEFLGKKLRCIRAWFTSHWHNTSLDLASALDVAWISHFPHDLDQGWPVYVAFMQLVFFSRLTSVCSSLQSHWLGAVLPVDYRKYRTMSCVLSESIAINLAVLLSYCSSNLERKREEYEIHFCMTEILIYRWYYGGMYVSCRAKSLDIIFIAFLSSHNLPASEIPRERRRKGGMPCKLGEHWLWWRQSFCVLWFPLRSKARYQRLYRTV